MRKIIASFLCVLLLLSGVPSYAADINVTSNTQDEKLRMQLPTTAFRFNLAFSAEGDGFLSLDGATWTPLKALFQALNVDLSSTVILRNSVAAARESILSLRYGDEEWTNAVLLSDQSGINYLKSPLLSDDGLYYAADKAFDVSGLLNELQDKTGWPSLLHVLYSVNSAGEDWQKRFEQSAAGYQAKITAWLQSYSATSAEADVNGGYITTITYQIPAAAVLQEVKQLLVDFYSDTAMISLLREVMNVEEQAAYLQSAMLLPFLQMLDNVKLSGEITVKRQYDYLGAMVYESISLPFAQNAPLESISYVRIPVGEDYSATFHVALRGAQETPGVAVKLSVEAGEKGIYTGDCVLTLPVQPLNAGDAWTTRDIKLGYQLYAADPVDTADVFNSRWSRDYEMTLLLRPDEALNLSPISVALTGSIYSKKATTTAVTYVDAALTVSDTEKGGSVKAVLSGKTARAWAPTLLTEAPNAALRVDLMDQEARTALIKQVAAHVGTALEALAQRAAQALLTQLPSVLPGGTVPDADG